MGLGKPHRPVRRKAQIANGRPTDHGDDVFVAQLLQTSRTSHDFLTFHAGTTVEGKAQTCAQVRPSRTFDLDKTIFRSLDPDCQQSTGMDWHSASNSVLMQDSTVARLATKDRMGIEAV